VKDLASQANKNFYRVLLYSGVDDSGKQFFGPNHPPTNLYENEAEFKFVSAKLNQLLRFNVWVDAILMRSGNYFIIRDTELAEPQKQVSYL
jgi:hypothetical protein